MEIQHFFLSPSYSRDLQQLLPKSETFASQISILEKKEDWEKLSTFDLIIFGVGEERATPNKGTTNSTTAIRNKFIELSKFDGLKIADLGDFNLGETHKDTLKGLEFVLEVLFENRITPILIGGGNELFSAAVAALSQKKKQISLTLIDPRLDIISSQKRLSSYNFLNAIVLNHLDSIYNITNIGLQTYYNSPQALKLYEDLYFDAYRLGIARSNIANLEPVLRDTHLVSFDISSIKQADAPAHKYPSVNGFYAEEACQIAKYAGLSDSVRLFGLFEHNPVFDRGGQTASLSAQIIWHFIDGFIQRQNDYPNEEGKYYTKFIVQIDDTEQEFVFYKNIQNGRWWAEISFDQANKKKTKLVSCTEEDYQLAAENQIPDLWWKTLQKLNQRKS